MAKSLERFLRFTVLTLLLVAPTQWSLEVRSNLHLTLADPLLALGALLFLMSAWRGEIGQRLVLPSPFAIFFVFWGAVSITVAADRPAALKDFVQWTLYFIVGWMLIGQLISETRTRRSALFVVTISAAIVLFFALIQVFSTKLPDIKVGGTFGNRNVLAGFAALTLPFVLALLLDSDSPVVKAVAAIASLLGLTVLLSGAAALAIAIAFIAMAAFRGRAALTAALLLIFIFMTLFHPRLTRRVGLRESWPDAEEWHDPWMDSIALHEPTLEMSRRYPEWEVAWRLVGDHPWRGVGAGNYQQAISEGSYRNVATRPGEPEPDTQNLYLVLAVSAGLPALLAFMAILIEGIMSALKAMSAHTRLRRVENTLALGTFGALLAFAITAIWHPLLVRGIGIPLVAVLTLAGQLGQLAQRD